MVVGCVVNLWEEEGGVTFILVGRIGWWIGV